MPMQTDKSLLNLMIKILNHLPEGKNFDLITLKGHLIIEQELKSLLLNSVKSEKPINEARLSFRQLTIIIKAFLYHKNEAWLWEAFDKINTIRNQYTHQLEPNRALKLIIEFVELIEANVGKEVSDLGERYRRSIAHICGNLIQKKIKI